MKLGIEVKIDVTKIEKARLYKGEKGTYLTMTTFIDTDNKDQYGNNGFIAHSTTKDERDQQIQGTIVGNSKVFYSDAPPAQQGQQYQGANANPAPIVDDYDDDIPF